MSCEHISELAELLTPPNSALHERLKVLHQRFLFDAKQLEDSATNWTDHYLAQVFRRCCEDLGLVLGGETPPPPGVAWKKQERPK